MISAEDLARYDAARQERRAAALEVRRLAGYHGCMDCVPREHGVGTLAPSGWHHCPKHECPVWIDGRHGPAHQCTLAGYPTEFGQVCTCHYAAAAAGAELAAQEGSAW